MESVSCIVVLPCMSDTGGCAAKDVMALALKIESTQLNDVSLKLYPLAMPA